MIISISNLGLQVTEESLRATFSAHGSVSRTQLVIDSRGKPDGSALLEMPDATEAVKAITHINGCIMDGKAIIAVQQHSSTLVD